MNKKRVLGTALTLAMTLVMTGCDPVKDVVKYYASVGLNALAVPQTGLKPGIVILVNKKGEAAMFSSVYDDYFGGKVPEVKPDPDEPQQTLQAALREVKTDKTVAPGVAGTYLSSLLNSLGGAFDMKLSSSVSIAPVQAKIHKVSITQLVTDINSAAGDSLRDRIVTMTQDQKLTAYVAYQIYTTDSLDVCSAASSSIASELNVGQSRTASGATSDTRGDQVRPSGSSGGKGNSGGRGGAAVPATGSNTLRADAGGCAVVPTQSANAPAPQADILARGATGGSGQKAIQGAAGSLRATFSFSKSAINHLQIKGTTQYAFAFRSGRLVYNQNRHKFDINPTDFKMPTLVKGSNDTAFTTLLHPDYSPVRLRIGQTDWNQFKQ